MGEAKRRRDSLSPVDRHALDLTRDFANNGMLIEGGFSAYVMTKIGLDNPLLSAFRDAYMAGAEHLWTSVMATLDNGSDETPADLRRMALIQAELDKWRDQKMAELATSYPTKGNA